MNKKTVYFPVPKFKYVPKSASSPGLLVKGEAKCLGMSRMELARRLGIAPQTLYGLFSGKIPLSHEFAMKLESVLGIGAEKWSSLEAGYRQRLYELKEFGEKEREFLSSQPYKDLEKFGLVKGKDDHERYRSLLAFYKVAGVRAWNNIWGGRVKNGMEAAIVRCGEILRESGDCPCGNYSREALKAALAKMEKSGANLSYGHFMEGAKKRLAKAGVALNIVPWKGNKVKGASKWFGERKAMIVLNPEGMRQDRAFFAFYHETYHVLQQKRLVSFLSCGEKSKEEEKADRFAYEALLPGKADGEVAACKTKKDLLAVAEKYGRPLYAVAGRYALLTGDERKFSRYNPIVKCPKGAWQF